MGKNIKTLRRFLALVMAFGVVAGLCACTQQSSSSAPPSATSSESQTPDAVVAEWPDFLTVGGGSTGGVFFSAAAGIAQLLSSETDTTLILPELSADSVGLEASSGASSLDLEPQETKDSIMTVARSVARAFFRDISFSSLKIMNMFFCQEHDVRTPS